MATLFSNQKFPPVPILPIHLSSPGDSTISTEYDALLDTGSDFTLVPLRYLLAIKAPETRSAFVRGLFIKQQLVTLYLVDIHTKIGLLSGYEVIGIDEMGDSFDSEEIILGRNVLNRLILLLNGPNEETHLLEQFPRRL